MSSDYFECTACHYRGVHAIVVGAGNFPPSAIAGDTTDRTGEFRCPNCGAQQTWGEPVDMSQPLGVTPPLDEPTDLPTFGPTTAETMEAPVAAQEEAKASTKGGK